MTIKVQCACGAKYSFDVEPVDGRMPFAVNCPACGADGTESANQIIAEQGGSAKLRVRVATPANAVPMPPALPQQVAVAVSAMERLREERRQMRRVAWIAAVVALVVVALVGAWGWVAFVGSKPRLAWSLKVPGDASAWRTGFLDDSKVFLVSPARATVHDLLSGKDLWSTTLSETASETGAAAPKVYVDHDSLWICPGSQVLRLDRLTGKIRETIPIAGRLQSFTPTETNILVVSSIAETTRLAMRIDLATGESPILRVEVPRSEKHLMPNELPPNVAPTANVLLSQALDEQKFNKPLDAMSSEFFSAGENMVELRVKLLEPKVTWVQSIKPRGSELLNGNLTAGSSGGAVEEQVLNDIKRSQTGGVKSIDESRYEVKVRRWLGEAPVEWTGRVTGVPAFFSLPTVDILAAGKLLTVFDKKNKELFEAGLSFPVNDRFTGTNWDRHSVPAAEDKEGLYFFDEGVLTAFSLPGGDVRWRLTSIGISKVQFDDQGALYVDSTTASPQDIQYSEQITFDKAAPVLLKVDPATGKILWQAPRLGQDCFLSGKFLYTASVQKGGMALTQGLAEALNAGAAQEGPVYFHLYRLDPATGDEMWDFYRAEAPAELYIRQNRILARFGNDVEAWKYIVF
jgi:outer membrane protein assembly factor BamB